MKASLKKFCLLSVLSAAAIFGTVGVYAGVQSGKAEAAVAAAAQETNIVFSKQNLTSGAAVGDVSVDPITISFAKSSGSNAPAYYSSGTSVRLYAKNTFTVSAKDLKITNIAFTYGSKTSATISADSGSISGNTWTGNADSITFTIGDSGQRHIQSMTVTCVTPSSDPYVVLDNTVIENELVEGTASGTITVEDSFGGDIEWAEKDNNESIVLEGDNTKVDYIAEAAGAYTIQAKISGTVLAECVVTVKVVESIALSGDMSNKTYYVGDAWQFDGLKLTVNYTDETNKTIDNAAELEPLLTADPENAVAKTTSIDLMAEYNGVCSEIFTVTGIVVQEKTPFTKVTNIDDLIVGSKVLIGNDDGSKVMQFAADSNNIPEMNSGIDSEGRIIGSAEMGILNLGSADDLASGAYSLNNDNGYLFAASSSKNYLRYQKQNNANGAWKITFASDGTPSVVAQGSNTKNVLRYNKSNAIFSCYASGLQPIMIFQSAPTVITDSIWADNLLVKLGGECGLTSRTEASISHQWDVVKALATKFDTTALKDAAANQGGTNVEKALARYDFIVAKYGFEDYLNRGIERLSQGKLFFASTDSSETGFAVTMIVLAGAFVATAALVLVKKKKNA